VRPTIGRIVIYRDVNGFDWPAIVQSADRQTVNLVAFSSSGPWNHIEVEEARKENERRRWRWPDRGAPITPQEVVSNLVETFAGNSVEADEE
jgi:hypothetical protein